MILFIFEGERREPKLYNTIRQLFLPQDISDILCTYKSNIYSLYSRLKGYDVFDEIDNAGNTVSVLNQILLSNGDSTLDNIPVSDISEIYLFFDYDFHHNRGTLESNNDHIREMLEYFNDETGNGKLYINYPMVDSIRYTKSLPDADYKVYNISRDQCGDFKNLTAQFSVYPSLDHILISNNTNESAQSCELHNKDVLSNWVHLIGMNMYKANYICTMQYCCPQSLENISQSNIFNNQLLKYVETDNCCVAILNAFPIFIADYIGLNKTRILYGL